VNRRSFLKLGAATVVLPVLPSLLSGCAPARPVMDFLIELATNTASVLLAGSFQEAVQGFSPQDQAAAEAANQMMALRGFTDFGRTRVATNIPGFFYGADHQNGYNTCAPIVTNGAVCTMIEGPIIVGLALASRDWPSSLDVSCAYGLLPLQTWQDGGSQLEVSSTVPSVYQTSAGYVSLNYQVQPKDKTALISVVAQRDNGGVLFGQDYVLHA
jgi:hypothetical protein